ncbi:MAG: DNA methylase, partial [Firmicutes bacterium]|nr:DNA methylase [Bacillota bacterium]
MKERIYLCIDLKSFYASVECVERGLNAMTTNLVVADASRTDKTICLAVSPSLKSFGISGRPRLFEVNQRVRQVNQERARSFPALLRTGSSTNLTELLTDPALEISFIIARPRMALYIEYSTRIYEVYLKYVASEDIHVYSIDEVFIDLTDYLETYKKDPEEIAREMIRDVLNTTGITATAGIGTNLYLAKVAMDIVAKKMKPDENGVRIARLDELTYRKELWDHQPLTDFWRVGRGYERKLEEHGLYTMGDIARCSIGSPNEVQNEELLYRLFGVNAELLIDHAWGWEPCTMAQIKAYKPETNSVGAGQVLQEPYPWEKAKLVVREMTDQVVLTVGYDIENLTDPQRRKKYKGPVKTDHYGRQVPKHAHGTANLN